MIGGGGEKRTLRLVAQYADALVRNAEEMRELGYTVAYVYARDITEPAKIIDTLAAAAHRLG